MQTAVMMIMACVNEKKNSSILIYLALSPTELKRGSAPLLVNLTIF